MTLDQASMQNVRYIAETDGKGSVAWVWRFGQDDRTARPLVPARLGLADLDGASFHGASEQAIRRWVMDRIEKLGNRVEPSAG